MATVLKYSGLVALILLVIVAVKLFMPSTAFGAVSGMLAENYIPYVSENGGYNSNYPIKTSGTSQVGANGTAISRIDTGQCYFAPSATTIAGSSTVAVDCQATAAVGHSGESPLLGVTAGDNVVIEMSTSTSGTTVTGISDTGCSASSTPGYITCNVANTTGTTYTWPTTGIASGTASYIDTH